MKNKLLYIGCFILGVLVGYFLLPYLPSLVEDLRNLPTFVVVYWIFWGLLFLLFISTGLQKNGNVTDENTPPIPLILLKLESAWNKSLRSTSLLLLSACVYGLFYESHFLSEKGIAFPVLSLAVSALFTLASSSFLPLVEFFVLSWEGQNKNSYHYFLYRIAKRVSSYWHSVPFFFCIIQLMSASYILLSLYHHS